MAGERGKHLLTVFADIPSDIEDDFNNWYNTQHIPERLAIPGFQSAARYVSLGPEPLTPRLRDACKATPKYLALYELEDASVLETPAYTALRDKADDWDRRIMPKLQVEARTVYEHILSCGEAPETHAPILFTARIDVSPEIEDEFNQWYDHDHLPNLGAVPGVHSARRYRKLSGAGATYLAVYEMDHEGVTATDAWEQASNTDWTKKMRPHIKPIMVLTLGKRIF
jgi:hypothetical protein